MTQGSRGPLVLTSDPDAHLRVEGLDSAVDALVSAGFLLQAGTGYTGRWAVEPGAATKACLDLMRETPDTALLLVQAGQRLATWASTVLKNADTAAASWAETVSGPTPTVRQPPLVLLR